MIGHAREYRACFKEIAAHNTGAPLDNTQVGDLEELFIQKPNVGTKETIDLFRYSVLKEESGKEEYCSTSQGSFTANQT